MTNWVAIHRIRRTRGVQDLVDSFLKLRRDPKAAKTDGEMHPRKPHVILGPKELNNRSTCRRKLLQQFLCKLNNFGFVFADDFCGAHSGPFTRYSPNSNRSPMGLARQRPIGLLCDRRH